MTDKAGSGPAAGSRRKRIQNQRQSPAYGTPEWRSAWLRCVDAACTTWKRLPYNDLAQTGGDAHKLVALLKLHYELSERDARHQAKDFLAQCGLGS